MPATKDKVAAANARAIDDRLAGSSSAAIVSAPSGSRLNVPSGSASTLNSAPSSPDVDISSSKADGNTRIELCNGLVCQKKATCNKFMQFGIKITLFSISLRKVNFLF